MHGCVCVACMCVYVCLCVSLRVYLGWMGDREVPLSWPNAALAHCPSPVCSPPLFPAAGSPPPPPSPHPCSRIPFLNTTGLP